MNSSTTRIIYAICALAFVVIVARAYLNVKGTDALVATIAQPEVQAFAKERLDALQPQSFAGDIELCGIVFETSDGTLGATNSRPGEQASCNIAYFDEPGMVPVASFHTHGKHSEAYDGEVPSTIDIRSDVASGMDGYVATPGGRLWHIDHETATARMVCGEGCLTQDPSYVPCPGDMIAQTYTLAQLEERFSFARSEC
ncbi:hypothetical protein CD351_09390 [Erythrobacter sp. KY5]|uniref:DUF4329 domain-containing protein n=1 Tax=Erythrobacter sp. KY5 TaxID=2011159 RepID=UPI000DBF0DCB|nr:DUF4329 domain-containing protein [Erythrobacter sp. KY5]AWW74634.1 hypothetical protein CD351_09390 [Erythrobacter sp. KY5]